jgi:hypothetical protein
MWKFFMFRLRRLIWLVIVVRLARFALLAIARQLEKRNHGATTTSRTLVWVGNALPRSGHHHAAKA